MLFKQLVLARLRFPLSKLKTTDYLKLKCVNFLRHKTHRKLLFTKKGSVQPKLRCAFSKRNEALAVMFCSSFHSDTFLIRVSKGPFLNFLVHSFVKTKLKMK